MDDETLAELALVHRQGRMLLAELDRDQPRRALLTEVIADLDAIADRASGAVVSWQADINRLTQGDDLYHETLAAIAEQERLNQLNDELHDANSEPS